MTTDASSAVTIRAALRVPPFWPERPALWFSQLEGQFALNGITDDSLQFWHVVGALDSRYAAEVEDVITNPPTEQRYQRIKTELVKRLSASQEQNIRQLMEREEMGDRKPSQFLRHLRQLAGNNIPDSFLRSLWIGRLPSHLQPIVTMQDDRDLDAVATLADRVYDITPRPQVAAASASDALIGTLLQRVEDLSRQVAALSVSNPRARSRSRPRGRSFSRRPGSRENSPQSDTGNRLCYYHYRFGPAAWNCRPPCSFRPQQPEN